MRYALEQKRAGRIRCIGLSSHNPEVALAAVERGLVEVLMFSVNPVSYTHLDVYKRQVRRAAGRDGRGGAPYLRYARQNAL